MEDCQLCQRQFIPVHQAVVLVEQLHSKTLDMMGMHTNGMSMATLLAVIITYPILLFKQALFQVQLKVDNGFLTNTYQRNILVVNPPDSTLAYSQDPTLLCNEGVIGLYLPDTEAGITYQLVSFDGEIIASSQSNGGSLTITSPLLNDTSSFLLRAGNVPGNCYRYFADTITVDVEEVKAMPYANHINLAITDSLLLHPRNINGSQFYWFFENGQLDVNTSEEIPVSVLFSETGLQEIQLVTTSYTGCSDTATTSLNVYDPALFDKNCWAVGNLPFIFKFELPVTVRNL